MCRLRRVSGIVHDQCCLSGLAATRMLLFGGVEGVSKPRVERSRLQEDDTHPEAPH